MPRETSIQKTIKDKLNKLGWFVIKISQDEKHAGFPDLLALKNNRALLIETKTLEGKLRKIQYYLGLKIKGYNNDIIVARSWKDVYNYLKKHNLLKEDK